MSLVRLGCTSTTVRLTAFAPTPLFELRRGLRENFWSLLKRTLNGTYVSVEPFHLFRYLDEQAYRFNSRKMTDADRFDEMTGNVVGKRLTYNELTGGDRDESIAAHEGEDACVVAYNVLRGIRPMAARKRTRRAKRPAVVLHKHASGATALRVKTSEGEVVAYENLRVLITKQDGAWLAQGLEIDYAIDGATIPEVKQRFQAGLAMTIESHLRVSGHIRELLTVAPREFWTEYFDAKNSLDRFTHSQMMIAQLQQHLPFDHIVWAEPQDQAA